MTSLPKFDELRLKTDRQLIQLLNSELDLGICYAHQALKSGDNRAIAKNHHIAAKRAYREASRLIFLAGEMGQDQRHGLDSKLEHLREMLEPLSAIGSTPTNDEIAALARALWKARGCPEGLPEEDWFQAERALKCCAA